MILQGQVVSGLGEASSWVKKIKKIFYKKMEMELFEGTLNIDVKRKYLLGTDVIKFSPNEYGGTQEVLVKECSVLGDKAYILRTKANENEQGTQPINIIEIVSNVNFREKYNLKDGDKIEIIM